MYITSKCVNLCVAFNKINSDSMVMKIIVATLDRRLVLNSNSSSPKQNYYLQATQYTNLLTLRVLQVYLLVPILVQHGTIK